MRPLREDVSIGPITTPLRQAAVENGWFDDEEDNRMMGFGSGEVGKTAAREGFVSLLGDNINDCFLVGIYMVDKPAGFFVIQQYTPHHKTAGVHAYVSPEYRIFNVFRTAMIRLLALLFENGTYRVESDIFSYNKPALSTFLSLGFKREGYKRASYWVDGNPMTQVLTRMLRKDFKSMYKGVI
jgi:RimJ/RimL family protein N-acetyltransferase